MAARRPANPVSASKTLAKRFDGLEHGWLIEQRTDQTEVEIGEQAAAVDMLVPALVKDVDANATVLPAPHFSHVQAPIDLQLVETTAGPDDFNGKVRCVPALIGPDEVALIGFRSGLFRRVFQRPCSLR